MIMSSFSYLVVFAVLVAVVSSAPPTKYTDKYDNINVDAILANDRVLTNYMKCVLDQGPCSPQGQELRKHLPEALQTSCAKCTDTQKNFIRKISNHLIQNRKSDWDLLKKKYDPKNQHSENFKRFLAGN